MRFSNLQLGLPSNLCFESTPAWNEALAALRTFFTWLQVPHSGTRRTHPAGYYRPDVRSLSENGRLFLPSLWHGWSWRQSACHLCLGLEHDQRQSLYHFMAVALFYRSGGNDPHLDTSRPVNLLSRSLFFDEDEDEALPENQRSRQTYPTLHFTLFHWRLVCPIPNVQEPQQKVLCRVHHCTGLDRFEKL